MSKAFKNPWKRHSSTVKYDNPWIQVRHDEVTTPGNTAGIYGKIHFKNIAIGVIPIDKDLNTWLVGQYRYVLEAYSWEIPEGGCPVNTHPLISAERELQEETGLTAEKYQEIMRLHTSNSVCDEEAIIYLATELTQGESSPEDTEDLTVKKIPLAEAIEMVHRGEITDSVSVAGLLKAAHMLKI